MNDFEVHGRHYYAAKLEAKNKLPQKKRKRRASFTELVFVASIYTTLGLGIAALTLCTTST